MQFSASMLAFLLATVPSLVSTNPISSRQQGDEFYAVSTLYTGGGCTGQSTGYAVFGAADTCQSIPASVPHPVTSFNTSAIYQELAPSLGCTQGRPLMLSFFTDEHCTQGRTTSELGNCEQASGPFLSLELECVMG